MNEWYKYRYFIGLGIFWLIALSSRIFSETYLLITDENGANFGDYLWEYLHLFCYHTTKWSISLLLIPLFIFLKNKNLLTKILSIFVAGGITSFLFTFLGNWIYSLFVKWEGSFSATWAKYMEALPGFLTKSIVYQYFYIFLLLAFLYAVDFYFNYYHEKIKNDKLNLLIKEYELQTLKEKLNPHFLFNSLHTVSMMIRQDKNELAIDTIADLSSLLRATVYQQEERWSTLKEEIALTQKYISIEQRRVGADLTVQTDIAPNIGKAKMPRLLLMPIVENAFKHGISNTIGPRLLTIKIEQKATHLSFSISNSGKLLSNSQTAYNGFGLQATKKRLDLLYNGNYQLDLSQQDDLVQTTISIPYEEV